MAIKEKVIKILADKLELPVEDIVWNLIFMMI